MRPMSERVVHKDIVKQQREMEGEQRLVELAGEGDVEGVRTLLREGGIKVNAEGYNMSLYYKAKNYWTPLHHASARGHSQVVQALIENDADLEAVDMFAATAVHLAAEHGHVECLRLLLDAGASCNLGTVARRPQWVNSDTVYPYLPNTRPLHLAALNNHIDCILELMLNGADYNSVDGAGRTPLYISAEGGYEDAVLAQLQNACGKTILSLPAYTTEETALHHCVEHGMRFALHGLLVHGSDVNHINHHGFSPLHIALFSTTQHSAEMVQEIVLHGYNTDLDLRDLSGVSPLEYVCFRGSSRRDRRSKLAAFLIAHGADFTKIKSVRGQTLLQQELDPSVTDNTILHAVISAMTLLPSLASLGINARPTPPPSTATMTAILPPTPHPPLPPLPRHQRLPQHLRQILDQQQQQLLQQLQESQLQQQELEQLLEPQQLQQHARQQLHQLWHQQRLRFMQHQRVDRAGAGGNEEEEEEEEGDEDEDAVVNPAVIVLPPLLARRREAWLGRRAVGGVFGRVLEGVEDADGEYTARLAWYNSLAGEPRSLQQYCRVCIRSVMKPARLRRVTSLPLPVALQQYLLLDVDAPF